MRVQIQAHGSPSCPHRLMKKIETSELIDRNECGIATVALRKCAVSDMELKPISPQLPLILGLSSPLVLPGGKERNGEDSCDQSSPGLGASAAEWGGIQGPGELGREGENGDSPSAVDTSGFRGDWTQEGASSSSQKNERRPQKRVPECRWGTEDVHPVPVLVPPVQRRQRVGSRSRGQSVSLKVPVPHIRPVSVSTVQPVPVLVPHRPLRDRFTETQLQELERIFQRNHYLLAENR
ncbi:uncharacterized protein LOC110287114 [Mus caroli]|uniref:Uncharacterized protein LOC110287114 n=1 Tax=Mus caroli TaxID=10089 RepID=A0A6P5P5R3_MUSCR|nr:uncharacterized protein LOC110287114 [Mus caroli]